MKNVNRIRQIVRLRQFVKKWQMRSNSAQDAQGNTMIGCTLSPRFKQRSPFLYDSDEECCRMRPASPPPDVPEGYLAVYVGRERRRFIIPTAYLSHPLFRTLLDKAEEEFGFDHQGGLTIPCEVSVFKQVLKVLERNDPAVQNLSLEDFLKYYSKERDHCGSQALHSSKGFDSFAMAAAVHYGFGQEKIC